MGAAPEFRRLAGEWPHFEAEFGGTHIRAILTGMGRTHALEAVPPRAA